jgi:cytochrome c-type biogenesis protein CcmF
MNTGAILVLAAFGASGAGLAAYLTAWAGHRSAVRLGRAFHTAMTVLLAAASVLLMAAIFSNDFSITYVTSYSSRSLPAIYKVSAFWAGQAGTILLWALLQGLVGMVLLARKDDWEPATMSFLLVLQTMLMFLLVRLQPFASAPAPPDGNGLNPLLQDPWMAIHPPIVFIGYAALAAPFALSLAAMALKRDEAWVPRVIPWVLVAGLTLGLGLFLGGFWAYKVLGWGGYWGWDPVENSSLAPWIVATALTHGLLIQRATGALRRTNLGLGALAYALAIYSTYLTRSGVLADFSVHSFTDLGINTFLIAMLAITIFLPAVLLALRWRSCRGPDVRWTLSLSPTMSMALVALLVFTAILVVGTSWPIISTLAGSPASPGAGFYNRSSLPVGIAIAGLLSVAPLMGWAPSPRGLLGRQIAAGAAAGVVVAVAAPFVGFWPKGGLLTLLFLALAVAALVASLIRLARQLRVSPASTGPPIAHAGLAFILVGIVTTSAFDQKESTVLTGGEPQTALGHQLTLRRYVPDVPGVEPHFEVEVVPAGGKPFLATPTMFKDRRRDMLIARPYIESSLLNDIYISPVSYQPPEDPHAPLTLVKGQPHPWGDAVLTFRAFRPHTGDEGGFTVVAVVDVQRGEQTESVDLIFTAGPTGVTSPWTEIPLFEGASARMEGMKVESGTIQLTVHAPGKEARAAVLSLDVSHKPVVNALWLGVLVMAAGTALSVVQRTREARALAALPLPRKRRPKSAISAPPGMVPLSKESAPRP